MRRSLVGAAIAAGEYGRADQVAEESAQIYPNDPRTYVMSAELARARGNKGRALRDLRTARELRLQQLGVPESQQRSDANNAMQPETAKVADAGPINPEPQAPAPVRGTGTPAASLVRQVSARIRAPVQPAVAFATFAPAGGQVQAPATPLMAPNAPYKAELAQASLSPMPLPYQNPFRREGAAPTGVGVLPPTPSITGNAGSATTVLPVDSSLQRPLLPEDQLLESIDRDIASLREEVAPTFQVGLGIRGRSGASGFGRLTEFTVPMEAQFSPAGVGRLKVQVTPIYLDGERADQNNAVVFGTNPLRVAQGLPVLRPASQTATGVGLDVAYSYRFATVDIGTTPLGFLRENVIGGIDLAPTIAPNLRLHGIGERRAVTDSVLSYAGARDPGTGQTFGGVTRTRGYLALGVLTRAAEPVCGRRRRRGTRQERRLELVLRVRGGRLVSDLPQCHAGAAGRAEPDLLQL